MVREVDCQAGVLGSNPGGPKGFPFEITLMVSEVFDELMQVTPGLASERERAVACLIIFVCLVLNDASTLVGH